MKNSIQHLIKTGLALLILLTLAGCQTATFSLIGQAKMTLEVNTPYVELGAVTSDDSPVKIAGFIDNAKLGTYTMTYTAKVNNQIETLTRFVTVVDTTAPILTLKGSNPALLCPNKTYQEEGFLAMDNIDGDISQQVLIRLIPDGLKYSVKDRSNNLSEITRSYKKEDTQKPTLKLNGYPKLLLHVNSEYTEFGASATDNCDDVSKAITITNPINPKVAGLYKVTYTVSDQSGNTTTLSRDVEVTSQIQSVVYLTFDDGPSARTKEVLDILKRYGMKATFFVLKTSSVYETHLKRAISEGHTVAIHGYSHDTKVIYTSPEVFFENLTLAQNWLENVTGIKSFLYRFPGGSSNSSSKYNPGIMTTLTQMVKEKGYHYFDWNVTSGDGSRTTTADQMVSLVTKSIKLHKTSIVLMHDGATHYYTVEALPRILDYLVSIDAAVLPITMETPEYHHHINN